MMRNDVFSYSPLYNNYNANIHIMLFYVLMSIKIYKYTP